MNKDTPMNALKLLTLAALVLPLAGCDEILRKIERKPSEAQIYYEALEAKQVAVVPQPEITGQAPITVLPEPVYEAVVEPIVEPIVVAEPVYVPPPQPVYVQPCVPVFRVSSCDDDNNSVPL